MSECPSPEPLSWFEAVERSLDPLLNASALLALVEGAEACGLLRAMRVGTTAEAVARETGLTEDRVSDVCAALVSGGVVERDGSLLRLAPDWDVITGAAAFAPLADSLRMNEVVGRSLRRLPGGGGFAELSPADRLTYARAVSPNPFSPALVAAVRRARGHRSRSESECVTMTGTWSSVRRGRADAVRAAGLPAMTAVGVELDPDLAAEARQRAERLGVADRFEVVCGDASTVRLDGAFDVAAWTSSSSRRRAARAHSPPRTRR